MKKILFLALLMMSTTIYAKLPKDCIWQIWGGGTRGLFTTPLFSADSKKVYANHTLGSLILDVETGDSIDFYPDVDKMGSVMAESADGYYIINRNLEKYDVKTQQMIWKCPTRTDKDFALLQYTISENGKYMLLHYAKQPNSTNQDNTNIDIFDSETKEKVRRINVGSNYINNVFAISNDANYLALGDSKTVNNETTYSSYLIDAKSGGNIMKIYESNVFENLCMFSTKNKYCIVKNGTYIITIDLKTLQSSNYYRRGNRICHISKDEKYLVIGGAASESGLEVLELGDNVMDLGKKRTILIGEMGKDMGYSGYARMSADNKYIFVGDLASIYCFDFEKILLDISQENHFQIILSPNPATKKISINIDNVQLNFKVINQVGKEIPIISNLVSSKLEIDISNLENGTYYLILSQNNTSKLYKFIKE